MCFAVPVLALLSVLSPPIHPDLYPNRSLKSKMHFRKLTLTRNVYINIRKFESLTVSTRTTAVICEGRRYGVYTVISLQNIRTLRNVIIILNDNLFKT